MDNNQNLKQDINNVAYGNKASKEQIIFYAIQNLREKGIITSDKDSNDLYNIYLKDSRDNKTLFDEINAFTKEQVEKKLNKSKIIKFPQQNKISVENVDDFQNQMETKSYIKIHYPYPSEEIKIVENYSGKKAKDLFEEAKDEDGLVSVDGFVNMVDVSKEYIEPDRTEVKLYNVTDLARRGEFMKLSQKEKECVIGLVSSIVNQLAKSDEEKKKLKQMPVDELILKFNKNVFIAPDENIVVLCVPDDPSKDEISAVKKNANGEYELEDLKISDNAKTSGTKESNEENEKNKENLGTPMRKKAPWEKRKAA